MLSRSTDFDLDEDWPCILRLLKVVLIFSTLSRVSCCFLVYMVDLTFETIFTSVVARKSS